MKLGVELVSTIYKTGHDYTDATLLSNTTAWGDLKVNAMVPGYKTSNDYTSLSADD